MFNRLKERFGFKANEVFQPFEIKPEPNLEGLSHSAKILALGKPGAVAAIISNESDQLTDMADTLDASTPAELAYILSQNNIRSVDSVEEGIISSRKRVNWDEWSREAYSVHTKVFKSSEVEAALKKAEPMNLPAPRA